MGGPLVESRVHDGLAALHVVVVHGRQNVVDERMAVHAFERHRGLEGGLGRDAEQERALQGQDWPLPLAAAERAQPHGLDQPVGGAARGLLVEKVRKGALR